MANIELVVKIDEEIYKRLKSLSRGDYFEHDICGDSMRRIANGALLPKGHGKLKDINKIYDRIDALNHSEQYKGKYTGVLAILTMADTIIEADNDKEREE